MRRDSVARLALLGLMCGGAACVNGRTSLQRTHAGSPRGEQAIQYVLRGAGSPVVVFESGLGDGADSWARVLPEVAQITTVFAYDRPGYGKSRPDTGLYQASRDGARAVESLRETLIRVGLAPPYVLVGHSLGGTYAELFARMHPSEVAGVVLVDPRTLSFNQQCTAAGLACEPPAWLRRVWPPHVRAEYRGLVDPPPAEEPKRPLPPVPFIVLSRGEAAEADAWQRLWIEAHQMLAGQVESGRQLNVVGSGHYIQRDKPQIVIGAIREVVNTARHRVETQER